MRYRIMDLIRQGTSAALLLGGFALGTSSLALAEDGNAPQNGPAFYQPGNARPSDHNEVYRQAGARLNMQRQQHMAQHRFIAMQQGQAPAPPDVPAGEAQAPAPPADNAAAKEGDKPAAPAAAPAEEKKEEPWSIVSLFDDDAGGNWMKDNGYIMGGWLAAGYSNHPDGSFTGNGPFVNQREFASFNLNQGYLFFGKVADGVKNGVDWGFRADINYGVDGNDMQAFGNNPGRWDYLNGWDHGIYEWAMPQLYGEIAMDTVSLKLGHFYTPHGYEVVTTPDNFFFSKQITFYNSEPFTHTGAMANWKAADEISFMAGWVLGWDTGFDQFRNGNMGMFGVTYNPSDKTSLVYTVGFGNFGWRGTGSINSAIVSHKWTDKLQSVHQFDVLQTNNGTDFLTSGIAGDSTGQINYLFYDLSETLRLGLRQEWYKADGASYNTITYGVNIKPTQNLVIRPEMRHNFGNTPAGAPGTITNNINDVFGHNDVFGVDVIVKF